MGYRSEVYFLCKKKDLPKIDSILKEKDSSLEDSCLTDISDVFDIPNDYIVLGDEWIKWYEGYKDVDAFNDMMLILQDEGIPFEFLRIGEDYEDVEWVNEYDLDFDIHITLSRTAFIG